MEFPRTHPKIVLGAAVALLVLVAAACVPPTPPPTAPAPTTAPSSPQEQKPPATTTTTKAPATTTTTRPASTCSNPKNPWANLAACGWPDASNTGVDLTQCPGGVLTPNPGLTTRVIPVTVEGTVISCQDITGSLDIRAKRVTIRNSRIRYDGGGANGSGVIKVEDGADATIDHVDTDGLNHTHSCVWHQGVAMSMNAVNCRGVNDGVFSWADVAYSPTTGDQFTIANSYFHDLTTNAANGHMDGYQTEGASNGLIRHNTYALTTAANSVIAIWNSRKSSANITVDNNLIAGGGFSVYAEDYSPSEASPAGGFTVTGITFTNNKFSNRLSGCVGQWGTWFFRASWTYQGGPTDGWHRTGNVVLETGENLDGSNPHVSGWLCS